MQNTTSTKKHLSATVYYLLFGLVLGWPTLFSTGYLLPMWQSGASFSPLSLAVIHLLILGSMLTVAFGVIHQIIPIAFQAPPVPRHVLFWHVPLHIISVAVIVSGFLLARFDIVGYGGSLLICSTVAFFILIVRSYIRARNKTLVHKGLSLPFVSLWLVLLIGLFQAEFPAQVNQSVVLTHVLLGGLSFWGGLVLVFSYKLIPMFSISHGYKASLPRSAAFYFTGTIFLVVSAWIPLGKLHTYIIELCGILLLIGLFTFAIDIVSIVRARKRRKLVLPLYDAFLSTFFFILGQIGIIFSVMLNEHSWLYPSIYLFGFCGLVPLMFSFMQKIVPFLWFEYRFSKRPERKTAPLIDDMVPRRTAQVGMGLYFLGSVIGFAMMLVRHGSVRIFNVYDWLSATCLAVGSITLFFALRHVLTIGGRRPSDDN